MNYNQKVGAFGEKLAKEYLIRNGYEIIDLNIKTSYKEIDIIAFKNEILVFIEVKTRTSNTLGKADEFMFLNKTDNLKQAIEIYLENFNKINYKDVRLDFISVDINKETKIAKIKYFKDIA